MSIPSQVEENAKIAEDLMERMNHPDSTVENPEVLPDEEEDELEADKPPAPKSAAPVEDDPEQEDDLSFKDRYLTLKGKYDAEVPRLSTELKEFKQSVLDRLGSVADKPVTAPVPAEAEVEDPVIAQFREEFGDEHADLMLRLIEAKSKSVTAESIKSSLTSVESKVQSVEDKQLADARKDFALAVETSLGPETKLGSGKWQELLAGNDPKFIEFLGESDPSGLYT